MTEPWVSSMLSILHAVNHVPAEAMLQDNLFAPLGQEGTARHFLHPLINKKSDWCSIRFIYILAASSAETWTNVTDQGVFHPGRMDLSVLLYLFYICPEKEMKSSLNFIYSVICVKTLSGVLEWLTRWRQGRDSYCDAYLLIQLFLRQRENMLL